MYIVIYEFKVKENNTQKFIDSWKTMLNLIKLHEGTLDSSLHKQKELHYIAYAQWPSKEIFDNSGKKLPKNVSEIRKNMTNSCEVIKTAYHLEVEADLLN